ncbi:uncharacterized protein UTRI_01077 [Ustilago trichophora]|uniref:Uncharacterized protein n=1 Tax=Ustilago trichophora TaxID=86804 RepID=A0A5C3DZ54_9BASI|nr:uncharacterized protein UTRI_01077 [Ustilago trichophora]
MSDLSPSQARGSAANGSGGGLHLPSFKDLVSFSKGDNHEDRLITPVSRRREIDAASSSSLRAVERSQDHVKVTHTSFLASHQIEPQSQQRQVENRPRTGEMTHDSQERVLHDPHNSTNQFSNGDARDNQSPRDEALRHHDSIVAQALKRPHDRVDYGSSHSRQAQVYKSSHQDTYMHVSRPSSHPLKRPTDEYRQVTPSLSSTLPTGSEERSSSSHSAIRRYNDEGRPLPTQPIPSQGSRVVSQSLQQYQSEARRRPQSGDQHIAGQRQIAHSPSQALPLDRSRNYIHPSPRPQDGSFGNPQRSSPSLPVQSFQTNCSAIIPGSHAQSASPRLPMPSSQGRMFDYSCARLPDERSLPSPSMSMRPPPSINHAAQRHPGSSHSTDAVRQSGIRRQRVPSNPEHDAADQRRYVPMHQQLVREETGGRHRADEPLPSPRYSHERPQPDGNGHSLHRASSSVDLRGCGGSKFLREERSPQMVPSSRCETSFPSPSMQMRAIAKPVQSISGELEFIGHRLASNGGARSDHTYGDVERSSRATLIQRPDNVSSTPRPPPTNPQQQVWEQDQRQRRQLEEERLRYLQQRRQPDPAPHPRQNGYDRRNEARDEQARRGHQHMQARQLRPQSMTPPSHTLRLEEGSHQMRALASSPGWREKPLKEAVYHVDGGSGRAVRPELPSPRSLHPNLASVEPSYHRRERAAEGSVFDHSPSQKRAPEEGQRVVNGSSRHYSDAERSTTTYREGQLQQFIVNGVSAPQARTSPAAAVYHTEAPVRYIERPKPSKAHRVYREPPHSRPQEATDLAPRLHPASENTRTQAPPPHYSSQPEFRPAMSTDLSSAGKSGPHPPHPSTVIVASQHTTITNTRTTISPPARPLKRLRAGSDTSLVLKASRFTVDEGDRQIIALPSSGRPPQSQPLAHAAVVPERLHVEARLYHSSSNEKVNSSGSAPITPPPSN